MADCHHVLCQSPGFVQPQHSDIFTESSLSSEAHTLSKEPSQNPLCNRRHRKHEDHFTESCRRESMAKRLHQLRLNQNPLHITGCCRCCWPVVHVALDVHRCYVQHGFRWTALAVQDERNLCLGCRWAINTTQSSARCSSGPSVMQQFRRRTPRTTTTST